MRAPTYGCVAMAIRARLQRYDSLLDLLVDELVREIEAESINEKPAESCQTSPRVEDFRHDDCSIQRGPQAAFR